MMTTDHPTTSKPRRRWFQYSLRTLFVLVTVLCVCLAVTANRARRQREAVKAIESVGGQVRYEYQYVSGQEPPGPEWLRELIGDEYFVSVVVVYLNPDFTEGRRQASCSGSLSGGSRKQHDNMNHASVLGPLPS